MTTLSRTTSAIILAASAWWWAVFVAMHILQPEFDPLRVPGSAHVLGAYGDVAQRMGEAIFAKGNESHRDEATEGSPRASIVELK